MPPPRPCVSSAGPGAPSACVTKGRAWASSGLVVKAARSHMAGSEVREPVPEAGETPGACVCVHPKPCKEGERKEESLWSDRPLSSLTVSPSLFDEQNILKQKIKREYQRNEGLNVFVGARMDVSESNYDH